MSAKPGTPITRKEMYLDVMTGGSSSLPEPITLEEMYLAKIAGMAVDLPTPRYIKHKYLAKIAGMTVNVPTYTMNLPRIYAYLAKAAGQDFEVPQPITREEMYWFDYVNGQPTPSEQEYTGAVPVTFIADGTPLIDYLISGNTVQSGTPTPDNPIMPEGVGERTANLWNRDVPKYDYVKDYKKYNPDNTIALKAGTYTVSSDVKLPIIQAFDNSHTQLSVSDAIAISSSYFITWDGFALAPTTDTVKSGTIILLSDCILTFAVSGTLGTYIMLNLGSTALPYEPYGYKIPISSANTTTPVYLGEVESTRKIKKLVLTGQERWYKSVAYRGSFYLGSVSPEPISLTEQAYCSHAEFTSISTYAKNKFCFNGSPINLNLWIGESSWTTDDFKAYLAQQYTAGTPVTVWYVLATEETGIINEPLMKIGDYTDTLSMEQAGAEIPTINGENTLDVLTAVKPSEVYIKYKGEPVAGSQTSSQSSAYAPAEVSSQSESIDNINSSLLGKEEETE